MVLLLIWKQQKMQLLLRVIIHYPY
jgi:hypothetical protein